MAVDIVAPGTKETKLRAALLPLIQVIALSRTTALPGSPSDGDIYIVPPDAVSNADDIALRSEGAWIYHTPTEGWTAYVLDDNENVQFAGGSAGWIEFAAAGADALDDLSDVDTTGKTTGDVLTWDGSSWGAAEPTGGSESEGSSDTAEWDLTVAASDETTDLTTGDSKLVFFAARDGTLTEVFTAVSGQSSSGDVTIDVRRNGTTIFATPPSINASEDTSLTGTVAVLSDTVWEKGDKIEIDIDAAGTGASGLKVTFLGTRVAVGEVAVFDRGSISTGTETPEPSEGAIQIATNDGAHVLAPPTETGYYVLTYTNGASAGAITATGWDAVLDPDSVLAHTTEASVVECAVLNDGVTSRLQVTLVVDAS